MHTGQVDRGQQMLDQRQGLSRHTSEETTTASRSGSRSAAGVIDRREPRACLDLPRLRRATLSAWCNGCFSNVRREVNLHGPSSCHGLPGSSAKDLPLFAFAVRVFVERFIGGDSIW